MFNNKSEFKREYSRRLIESYGTAPELTHPYEKYLVLGKMVRDYANVNWKDTKAAETKKKAKQVYYFSLELLHIVYILYHLYNSQCLVNYFVKLLLV